MTFSAREGLTDRNHLAKVMCEQTSLPAHIGQALYIIENYLERCIEIYNETQVCGYVLILNVDDERSFHGFKLIKGHALKAFEIAKDIVRQYPQLIITTTDDKKEVLKLAKMLGFHETGRTNEIVRLERWNA